MTKIARLPKIEIVPALGHYDYTLVAFTPDDLYVLSACHTTVKLWERATGRLIRTFDHRNPVNCLAVSPNGAQLMSCWIDIKIWDVATGEILDTITDDFGTSSPIISASFSSDGRRIIGVRATQFDVWDSTSGELLLEQRRLDKVRSAAITADGKHLVTGGRFSLDLWDLETGKRARTFTPTRNEGDELTLEDINTVSVSSDGTCVVSAGIGRAPRLWDLETGSLRQVFEDDTIENNLMVRTVGSLAISPNNRRVLSSGSSLNASPLKLWDMTTGQLLGGLSGGMTATRSVAWSSDGRFALAGSAGGIFFSRGMNDRRARLDCRHGAAELWNVSDRKLVRSFQGHIRPVTSLALCRNANRFVASSYDNYDESSLNIWDTRTGQLLRTIPEPGNHVSSVAISQDGARVLSGGAFNDGCCSVKLWDAATGKLLRAFEVPPADKTPSYSAYCSVLFSPDGALIASGIGDAAPKIWDAVTGQLLKTFDGIGPIAFSPDGTGLLSVGGGVGSRKLTLRDISTERILRSFDCENSDEAISIGFSLDGMRVLMGSRDGTMKLWHSETGELLRVFDNNDDGKVWGAIYAASFAPDGNHIVSGSADGNVKLWDATTGDIIRILEGHSAEVNAIAVSSDGKHMLSAGNDSEIRIWETSTGGHLATFVAGRDQLWATFTPAGFFTGAVENGELLNLTRGIDVCPIDLFSDVLFRPDLVEQRLQGDRNHEYADAATTLDLATHFQRAISSRTSS